jgi:hypothetical protein
VDLIREWIEAFLRGRIGYEGDQVYRALAVLALIATTLVAIWKVDGPLLCVGVLALLLTLWVLRGLPSATAAVLIAAILAVGWLLVGPLLTKTRLTLEGPMVRGNHVVVVACVKAPPLRGTCIVREAVIPDWHQREAWQERAQDGQAQ